MVPEAALEETEAGLVPRDGVVRHNAREARWRRPGPRDNLPFTGWTENEAETLFPQLGVSL